MIEKRVGQIQQMLGDREAAIIKSHSNRFYITGFESSAGAVLITKDAAYLLIDFRYVEKARQTVKSCEVLLSSKENQEICELCKKHNIKEVFVETHHTSISELAALKSALCDIKVSESDALDQQLLDMRSVKSRAELEYIKKAQKITDETFSYILERISIGRTEIEIMLDMEFFMRKLGSEGIAFDFIVVSGKNSSLPHGVPTDKKIENGDFITMDFGARVGGYRSDMTRTVAVGAIDERQKTVYNTVLKAQEESIKAIKAGVVCRDIDKIARDIIYSNGFEGCFGHGLGHSVGIDIHENPCFNMRCETVLKEGTVMTVEPGIYLENNFGVRIEDMVYTTADGCENLTASQKQLIVL